MISDLPIVTVVVPTLNEGRNIGNCLQSIKEQVYPKDKQVRYFALDK